MHLEAGGDCGICFVLAKIGRTLPVRYATGACGSASESGRINDAAELFRERYGCAREHTINE